MIKSCQAPSRSFRVLWYVVAFSILALMVAAVIIFYIPFLDESSTNRIIATLFTLLLILIVYLILGKGYYKSRPPKERRARFVMIIGFATFFLIAGLVVGLWGRSFRFPHSLLLLFVALLGAILVTLVADRTAKKLGRY